MCYIRADHFDFLFGDWRFDDRSSVLQVLITIRILPTLNLALVHTQIIYIMMNTIKTFFVSSCIITSDASSTIEAVLDALLVFRRTINRMQYKCYIIMICLRPIFLQKLPIHFAAPIGVSFHWSNLILRHVSLSSVRNIFLQVALPVCIIGGLGLCHNFCKRMQKD